MSRHPRKCPTCGGFNTHTEYPHDRGIWRCYDGSKHARYSFFDKNGPLTLDARFERLGVSRGTMSHNIYIIGYGDCPWQTPTYITQCILKNSKDDLESFEKLCNWVHEMFDPPPLNGNDASNPFLVERRRYEIMNILRTLSDIETHIRSNTSHERWIIST